MVLCKAVHLVENKTSAPSHQSVSLGARVSLRILPSYPGLSFWMTWGGWCHVPREGRCQPREKASLEANEEGQMLRGYKLRLNKESPLETNRSEIFMFFEKELCLRNHSLVWKSLWLFNSRAIPENKEQTVETMQVPGGASPGVSIPAQCRGGSSWDAGGTRHGDAAEGLPLFPHPWVCSCRWVTGDAVQYFAFFQMAASSCSYSLTSCSVCWDQELMI